MCVVYWCGVWVGCVDFCSGCIGGVCGMVCGVYWWGVLMVWVWNDGSVGGCVHDRVGGADV